MRAFLTFAFAGLGNLLVVGVDSYWNIPQLHLVNNIPTRRSDYALPAPARVPLANFAILCALCECILSEAPILQQHEVHAPVLRGSVSLTRVNRK